MKFPSYTVIIPAYNAENTIGDLITQLKGLINPPAHIFVIDDGSSDNTKQIVEKSNTYVIRFKKNRGKGIALQKGFELFTNQTTDEYLICMDADLQHTPHSIELFLERAQQSGTALVIGKREIKIGKMPFMRYLSNTITSYILSHLTGQSIKDSQCGFRLIPRNTIKDICFKENGFQFESEFILRCSEEKVPIEFVKIPTIYNKHGSSINHVGDTIRFIKLVLREIFIK